jgi:serine phosphatase RsbU (regulator of sigma subunit)
VTEAEAPDGEFFGVDRLKEVALESGKDAIITAVLKYAQDVPLGDDCSIFELTFTGGNA